MTPAAPPLLRRRQTPSGAIVADLPGDMAAEALFVALAGAPHRLFFDSAVVDGGAAAAGAAPGIRLGRYSFLTADPIHSIVVEAPRPWDSEAAAAAVKEAFAGLRALLGDLAVPTIPALPPFQGGIAGLVGYEAGLALLGVAPPAGDDVAVPLLSLHLYDVVFAFDHDARSGWLISQGIPARGPVARARRAAERIDAILALLDAPPAAASAKIASHHDTSSKTMGITPHIDTHRPHITFTIPRHPPPKHPVSR
ncbi:MAG: hypothetical protein ACKO3G_08395, partial [Planctomycetaceae bacterium]